jgi:hypothetical protein
METIFLINEEGIPKPKFTPKRHFGWESEGGPQHATSTVGFR